MEKRKETRRQDFKWEGGGGKEQGRPREEENEAGLGLVEKR